MDAEDASSETSTPSNAQDQTSPGQGATKKPVQRSRLAYVLAHEPLADEYRCLQCRRDKVQL